MHRDRVGHVSGEELLVHVEGLLSVTYVNLVFSPGSGAATRTFGDTMDPVLRSVEDGHNLVSCEVRISSDRRTESELRLPTGVCLGLRPGLRCVSVGFVVAPGNTSFSSVWWGGVVFGKNVWVPPLVLFGGWFLSIGAFSSFMLVFLLGVWGLGFLAFFVVGGCVFSMCLCGVGWVVVVVCS